MEVKHLEIKSYKKNSVVISVKIDYDKGRISLVEKSIGGTDYIPKKWYFADRDIDYMRGWQMILDSMKYAIEEATKSLENYLKSERKMKEKTADEIIEHVNKFSKKKSK